MNLNEQREKEKRNEMGQARLFLDLIKKKRERWEFSDIAEQMAFDKNNEDILLVAESLGNWSSIAVGEKKKILDDLWLGVIRISCYCNHLETVTKKSISEYRHELKTSTRLVSEKRTLELELLKQKQEYEQQIKSLKAEISFLSRCE
jgi:hypothetical protein